MVKWLLYLIPAIFFSLLGYLLNPFVVLLADEEGELDGIWHYFQTWDDSLDSEFFMTEVVPKCLDYGYHEHYIPFRDTDKWTRKYDKVRQFSVYRPDATWTTKQRIQRYICRVLWLYRNNAYGFLFYLLGADMSDVGIVSYGENKFRGKNDEHFVYKDESMICKHLRWKIYLGWKTYPGQENPQRCMYAYRLWIEVV